MSHDKERAMILTMYLMMGEISTLLGLLGQIFKC